MTYTILVYTNFYTTTDYAHHETFKIYMYENTVTVA
jgi:hypothetical protein